MGVSRSQFPHSLCMHLGKRVRGRQLQPACTSIFNAADNSSTPVLPGKLSGGASSSAPLCVT